MVAITTKGKDELDRLIREAMERIRDTTDRLSFEQGFTIGDWYADMERTLKAYHLLSFLDGLGVRSYRGLDGGQKNLLSEIVGRQLDFLEGFADDIKQKRYEGKTDQMKARAILYPMSMKSSWWSGRTIGWPLPAMPGDGTTQCIVRCKCAWVGKVLDRKNLTGDWYWRMNSAAEHCQTCEVRASVWNPLKIRNGELI